MILSADTTAYVAIAGAGVGLLGFGTGLGAALRLRRLRRAYAGVAASAEGGDLLAEVGRQHDTVAGLTREVTGLRGELAAARTDLADAIRHVAVVRFDAFDDMGGRMSFSAALLDDAGDGLVLTSIHARSETRAYAKGIKAGSCEHQLSPEEEQVIGFALAGSGPAGQRGRP
ncbi:MAG TPA: DUF4446 family protein [Mycobacteriales bacterium]|nr:DUF4446 family protein [Mycobacteriales bacterium]